MKKWLAVALFIMFTIPSLIFSEETIFEAAAKGDVAFINNYKGDINEADKNGNTAIMYAAGAGQTDAVGALIEADADLGAVNNDGSTALIIAAEKGQTEAVVVLIEAEADVDAADNNGDTALMAAAKNGNEEAVRALIEADADVSAKNKNGDTALSLAKNAAIKKLLEEAEAE